MCSQPDLASVAGSYARLNPVSRSKTVYESRSYRNRMADDHGLPDRIEIGRGILLIISSAPLPTGRLRISVTLSICADSAVGMLPTIVLKDMDASVIDVAIPSWPISCVSVNNIIVPYWTILLRERPQQ